LTDTPHPAQLLFTDKHPLTAALDMKFEGVVDHTLTVTVKAPESFADRDGLHTHSAFSTLFLDTVMGSCVLGEMKTMQAVATIKLTTNHIARAKIGDDLICRATLDGIENEIAYVSGRIHTGGEQRLIATAIGTFMTGTATKSIREKT